MTEPNEIEIEARAAARALRFGSRPRMRTLGVGVPAGKQDSGSTRERLPAQVAPRRPYRDVGIRAWLRQRIDYGRSPRSSGDGE